jgi:hypothetical protein
VKSCTCRPAGTANQQGWHDIIVQQRIHSAVLLHDLRDGLRDVFRAFCFGVVAHVVLG